MRHYFISGGTGVVGSAIADALLSRPGNRIIMLIRAGSDEHVQSRLDELCRFWERDPAAVRGRVTMLRGDTTLPRFAVGTRSIAS